MTPEIFYKRLLEFGQRCQILVSKLPKTIYNQEYGGQLIRSSASPGANYIEEVEASSHSEFIYKLKVCRKETKESNHWLTLIQFANKEIEGIEGEADTLIREARELIKIFTSSILTAEKNRAIRK